MIKRFSASGMGTREGLFHQRSAFAFLVMSADVSAETLPTPRRERALVAMKESMRRRDVFLQSDQRFKRRRTSTAYVTALKPDVGPYVMSVLESEDLLVANKTSNWTITELELFFV